MSWPSGVTAPVSGVSNPRIVSTSVLLPAPLLPMMSTDDPLRMVSETPRSACVSAPGYRNATPSARSASLNGHGRLAGVGVVCSISFSSLDTVSTIGSANTAD